MRTRLAALIGIAALAGFAQAQPLPKVVFYTNWFAEAEHGGFYQALARGLYRRQGLDVEVKMGGPQVNGLQLLAAGRMDVFMGYDLQTLAAIEQGLPLVTIGATFQKDPTVLLAHSGVKSLEGLKGTPVYVSAAAATTFWPWLAARYGFSDAQKRPYAFSVQPFLSDPAASQQGYVTSEPFSVEKAGVKPVVFLLADYGYPPYAQTLVTTRAVMAEKGELLRRFMQASAEGWKSYLADPGPGNALIRKDNPQMEDALLAYGLRQMKQYGLVAGGDAAVQGLFTMTDARWQRTYDFMVSAGLLKSSVPLGSAYTLELVKKVRVLP